MWSRLFLNAFLKLLKIPVKILCLQNFKSIFGSSSNIKGYMKSQKQQEIIIISYILSSHKPMALKNLGKILQIIQNTQHPVSLTLFCHCTLAKLYLFPTNILLFQGPFKKRSFHFLHCSIVNTCFAKLQHCWWHFWDNFAVADFVCSHLQLIGISFFIELLFLKFFLRSFRCHYYFIF